MDSITLINPPSPWLISDVDLPPLGLLSLAASLREHDIEVHVADLAGKEEWREGPLPGFPRADWYGIGFTTPQYAYVKELVDLLPRSRTIVGGAHASSLPKRTLEELGIAAVFCGEADWALADFIQGRDWERIPGLVYRARDGVYQNPLPHVVPSLLPFPARDLVDIDRYHEVKTFSYVCEGASREGYVYTGRGCPFRCAFCAQDKVTGGRARWKTVQQVVDEVKLLLYRYGCDQIYFQDDTFNLDRARVMELCDAFRWLRFRWHCLCRANPLTLDTLRAMYSAGCRAIVFGFESGSNRILEAMNKGLSVEQNLRAAEMCHEVGIRVRAQMIVGFPGEDEESIAETEQFVREAKVDKWGFHAFVPLPGSDVWGNPEKYGYELDKDTDFEGGFTTIGKPGEWEGHSPQVVEWLERLNAVAGDTAIWRGMK